MAEDEISETGVHFPAGSMFPDIHTEGDAGVPYMGRDLMPNDRPRGSGLTGLAGKLATSGADDQAPRVSEASGDQAQTMPEKTEGD